jgi:hypothetical protein
VLPDLKEEQKTEMKPEQMAELTVAVIATLIAVLVLGAEENGESLGHDGNSGTVG